MSSLPNDAGQVKERRNIGTIHASRSGDAPASYQPRWVENTKNERNFRVMMDILELGAGEGRLGMIYGPAGRGKTRTTQRWATEHRGIYILALTIWKGSELGMLQKLCVELGMVKAPARKNDCFLAVVDRLITDPRTVFIDEMDLLPQRIEMVRQLSEATAAPIVLMGEMSLADVMTRTGRTWSRTFQTLYFEPVSPSDIIFYAQETAGLSISPDAAAVLHASPGGQDWRVVKRLTIDLVEIANSKGTRSVDEKMAGLAVKMGLKGIKA